MQIIKDEGLRRLLSIGEAHRKLQITVILFALVAILSEAPVPFLIERLLDNVMRKASFMSAVDVIGLIMFLETISAVAWWFTEYRDQLVEKVAGTRLQRLAYSKFFRLPEEYHLTHSTGEFMSKITSDVDIAGAIGASLVPGVAINCISLIIGTVVLLKLNMLLTGITLVTIPLYYLLLGLFRSKLVKASWRERDQYTRVTESVKEGIDGHLIIKTNRKNAYFQENLGKEIDQWVEKIKNLIKYEVLSFRMESYFLTVTPLFILGIGVLLSLRDLVALTVVIAFFYYVRRIYGPTERLVNIWTMSQRGKVAASRIFSILDEVEEHDEGDLEFPEKAPKIEFKDVHFSYDVADVLKGITVTVEKGEHVALVGESGAGKSTLIELVLRLYEIREGCIYIDGVSLNRFKIDSLRDRVVYAGSDPHLFNLTVRENILLGEDSSRDFGRICEICQLDFVRDFNVKIGELGVTLSDGQKQRIALARALIRRPVVLLLDEAISGVDAKIEEKIMKSIRDFSPDMTVLSVAHRLSTIKSADRILFIEDGKIMASGDHDDLFQKCPSYRKLFLKQVTGAV